MLPHDIDIVESVMRVLGRSSEVDFTPILPFLLQDNIEVLRTRGFLNEVFKTPSSWIASFASYKYMLWSVPLLAYLKQAGACFDGVAGVFSQYLSWSRQTEFSQLHECLKFCVDNDPIFPHGFSPLTAFNSLF